MNLEIFDFSIADYGGVWVSEGVKIPGIKCPWCDWITPVDEAINDQPCESCGKFFVVATAKAGGFFQVTMSSDDFGPDTAEVYAKNSKAAIQKSKKELGLPMDQEFDVEVERTYE